VFVVPLAAESAVEVPLLVLVVPLAAPLVPPLVAPLVEVPLLLASLAVLLLEVPP
jgi:hypothetical protein